LSIPVSVTDAVATPAEPLERRSAGWRYTLHLIARNPMMILGIAIIVLLVLMAVFAPQLSTHEPSRINPPERLQPPSANHWLGTDVAGRDIYSRIVHGSRITLQIGTTVITLALLIGYVIGIVAGFFGRIVDEIFMRMTDVFMSFPYLVLAMGLTVALGPSIQNAILAMAVVWWPTYARLVRSEVLKIRERPFIYASRGMGAGDLFIIVRHIIPNSWVSVVVQASLDFGRVIMYAASLSFIGLGAQPPTPEWGAIISDGRLYLEQAWWYPTFPGVAIMLTVMGFNLMGDGLRDIIDPRLRR
jgi:peptide/nickel transport system permease protein